MYQKFFLNITHALHLYDISKETSNTPSIINYSSVKHCVVKQMQTRSTDAAVLSYSFFKGKNFSNTLDA